MSEPAPTTPRGGKRSALFWTCGGCAFLGVAWMVGLAIGLAVVMVRSHSSNPALEPVQMTEVQQDEAEEAHWPSFHNDKPALPLDLQRQFVAFHFRYPADRFKLAPSPVNFVSLQRVNPEDPKAFVPMEVLYIAPVSATRTDESGVPHEMSYSDRLKETVKIVARSFEKYRSLEEKEDTLDGVPARIQTFEGILTRVDQTKTPILGKIIIARKSEAKFGLVIILSAEAATTDLTSADDVGVKGSLGKIMRTFHFDD